VEHLENIEVQYILLSYKRWFDQAFSKTTMKIFNTSEKGAKLKNTTFFNTTLKS